MREVQRARGFVRAELLGILVVGAVVVSLLSVAGDAGRRRARTAGSVANLQKYASGMTSFAADREDRIVSLWWQPGMHTDRTGFVFPNSTTRMQAAADQAVAIMRWHAGRTDILPIYGWFPHVYYNHLALVEHWEHPLPAEFAVSPHDLNRLAWQRSVRSAAASEAGQGFFELSNRPPGGSNADKRWPYSASYEFAPASFSPDARRTLESGEDVPTVAQDIMGHRYYQVGNRLTPLGQRRTSEIVFPSLKVLVYETHMTGDGGSVGTFYASSQARAPMLFGDGSVSSRIAARSNAGFFPNTPQSESPTRMYYTPDLNWEPPTTNGSTWQIVNGGIRWCRSGLRGRDFDGAEVPWVD